MRGRGRGGEEIGGDVRPQYCGLIRGGVLKYGIACQEKDQKDGSGDGGASKVTRGEGGAGQHRGAIGSIRGMIQGEKKEGLEWSTLAVSADDIFDPGREVDNLGVFTVVVNPGHNGGCGLQQAS